jgi:hypothetical protein
MCCVIRIAGASGGIGTSTSRIASVPPVDAPMMISFSVDTSGLRSNGAASTGAGTALLGGALRTRARAAPRILSAIISPYSSMPSRMPRRGLVTKSTAPNSSARSVTSEPRSVSDDTMSTGIGRRRMSFSRKSSPSMRGISTSSVSTSGLCCLIRSRATSGSGAVATTVMSGCALMISVIRLRTSAESSTHRTLIGSLKPPPFFGCQAPAEAWRFWPVAQRVLRSPVLRVCAVAAHTPVHAAQSPDLRDRPAS